MIIKLARARGSWNVASRSEKRTRWKGRKGENNVGKRRDIVEWGKEVYATSGARLLSEREINEQRAETQGSTVVQLKNVREIKKKKVTLST